jgi:hypothetical protein
MVLFQRRIFSRVLACAAVLIIAAAAAGCQPAPDNTALPTLVPTIAVVPAATAYPSPVMDAYPAATEPGLEALIIEATEAYPAGPGPASVPVVENRARVTARLIGQSADETRPGFSLLRVEVLGSEDIEGMQNFTREKLNQEIKLLTETDQMPDLQPGENFTAEVTLRGDEFENGFYASQIEKIAQ